MFAKKTTLSVSALFCAVLLAGCATAKRDSFTVGSIPTDYTKRHPIVLSEKEQTLDIPVASSARELSGATLSNIKAFATQFVTSGTGGIVVMLPSGSANEAAAHRVKDQIVDAVQSGGGSGIVTYQSYDASNHGVSAPVRLSFSGVTASTGACGKCTDDILDTAENQNYNDYGCSTQSNLAAQISNPGDLLGPRQMSPIDADNRAEVIKTYQQ